MAQVHCTSLHVRTYHPVCNNCIILIYGTSQLYHGFLVCMYLYPSCCYMYFLGLRPSGIHITALRVQMPYTLETHGTTITCTYLGTKSRHHIQELYERHLTRTRGSENFTDSLTERVYLKKFNTQMKKDSAEVHN